MDTVEKKFARKSEDELWALAAEEAELYLNHYSLQVSEYPRRTLEDYNSQEEFDEYCSFLQDERDYVRNIRLSTIEALTLVEKRKLESEAQTQGLDKNTHVFSQQFAKRMGHTKWRLNNLYYITDKKARKIKFKMNYVQEYLYDNLHKKNIVLKARQFGITTFSCIIAIDNALIYPNITNGIIAHNKEDAEKFFQKKIKYAYDNLDENFRNERPTTKNDACQLHILHDPDDPNSTEKSYINVGVSLRSDCCQFLHISEWAKAFVKDPAKAEEIRSGALNTVPPDGHIIIESTAEGNEGPFYDFCQAAMQKYLSGEHLTQMDYKFFFFPWWLHDDYVLDDPHVTITERFVNYFAQLGKDEYFKKSGHKLSLPQMRWYVKKEEEQQDRMKQEYPSTPDEAFEVALDGAYYSRQINTCYGKRRVGKFPINPNLPVHTAWDLGIHDEMSIWFFQNVGGMIHLNHYYEDHGYGFAEYIKYLRELQEAEGFMYGTHLAPHDINNKEMTSGKTRLETAREMGITFTAVPKMSIQDGIDNVRKLLSLCNFDEKHAGEGLEHLKKYRKEWDDKKGLWKNKPRHDKHSHGADAFRTMANGHSFDLSTVGVFASPHRTRRQEIKRVKAAW